MPINKQIINTIKKSFSKFDFTRLEERCTNEAQTRSYLIEPIFEMLGYSRIDDMATEINAGWGKKNDKADIGLIVKGKIPEIIVECKKYGKKLTDKEASQLNSYFINTKYSKFGILTNGIEWRFYAANESTKETKLYEIPFMVLDINELNDTLFENLSKFHRNNIDLKELHEEAQEFFFLEGFADAFANELCEPSDDFVKAIFNRMEGKRMTDQVRDKIRKLITSKAVNDALPRLIEEEAKSGNMIITTAEELKIYHAVKTILINSFKKIDPSRISYRDQKNSFNILIDENNKKMIAKVTCSKNKYSIDINGNKFDVNGLESIVAMSKYLKEAATPYLS
jgi:predicted type IV restriction endonuclease